MAAAVPFDFSHAFGRLPALSPIDYLCVLAAIAWIGRTGFNRIGPSVLDTFGWPALFAWTGFFIWAVIAAVHLDGSLRGPLRWMEFLFFFFMASCAVREAPDFKIQYAWVLTAMGGLISLFGLWQYFHSGCDYQASFGPFRQHNIQGAFLSLVMPTGFAVAYLRRERRSGFFWLAPLLMLGAFLCAYSRGSWIGLIGGITMIGLAQVIPVPRRSSKTVVFALVFLLALCSVAFPLIRIHRHPNAFLPQPAPANAMQVIPSSLDDSPRSPHLLSLSQRPAYWRAAYNIFKSHPWMGLGPGGYAAHLSDYLDPGPRYMYFAERNLKVKNDFWQHLHSIYLQILAEYGMIGFTLWTLGMTFIIARCLGSVTGHGGALAWASTISITAFMIHNSVDILFVNSLDLLFACHLAILNENRVR